LARVENMSEVSKERSIEERLAGVEGSLRRWKFACAALALVAVGVAADGGAVVKDAEFGTVKAKAFVVVDSKGKTLGSFGREADGQVGEYGYFAIGDEKGSKTLLIPGTDPVFVKK